MRKYIEAIMSGVLGLLLLIFPVIPVIGGDVVGLTGYDFISIISDGEFITAIGTFTLLTVFVAIALIAICVLMILKEKKVIKAKNINFSKINFITLIVASIFAVCLLISVIICVEKTEISIHAYSILNLIFIAGVTVADWFAWKKLAK